MGKAVLGWLTGFAIGASVFYSVGIGTPHGSLMVNLPFGILTVFGIVSLIEGSWDS